MQRWPVESSQLESVGYDSGSSVLEVKFKRGTAVYQYKDVPPEVHADLMNSKSKGKFFGGSIRNQFTCTKIEEKPDEANQAQDPQEGAPNQAQATAADTDSGSR